MAAALAGVALVILLLGRGGGAGMAADAVATPGAPDAQPPTAADSFEPELGLPAEDVVAFGHGAGASWAYGRLGPAPVTVDGRQYSDQYALLEHPDGGEEWQIVPLPEAAAGKPLAPSGDGEALTPAIYGSLAGEATPAGGVALLSGQSIAIRDPGQQPYVVPGTSTPSTPSTVTAGAGASDPETVPLEPGESLLPPAPQAAGAVTVPYAAIEEREGRTGVLIAPHDDGGGQSGAGEPEHQPGVLHWDGRVWTREPIAVGEAQGQHFRALAISCAATAAPQSSAAQSCWLLAGYGAGATPENLRLYRRVATSAPPGWSWQAQPVASWLLGGEAPPQSASPVSVSPLAQGAQMLTATAQGVWVDLQMRVRGEAAAIDVSQLVSPPGGEAGQRAGVAGTWCHPTIEGVCEAPLGGAFPSGYRSFAWPGSAPQEAGGDIGTRVITGLAYGAMLELSDGGFREEVGGGGEPAGGAALYRASPQAPVEGVIAYGERGANNGLDDEGQSPVVQLTARPAGDELHEEAVPFRHLLLAVAQAPETTPGDPGAEALAVGLNGQVGRYLPGEGWEPEALYNAKHEAQSTVNLRGVAWPEANRAYAVGDRGQMWMWMRETGYWVPDPAKPFNFTGNLNAIAFDPANPQLGFAVGKQGVILKYGKSWE
ncbi:MAG: hypothetical protein FWD42_04435, partial [Solirubrobacterales bacterium]|nr:hypothetical protein [Solirubrobacterales bacterium]